MEDWFWARVGERRWARRNYDSFDFVFAMKSLVKRWAKAWFYWGLGMCGMEKRISCYSYS